MIYDIYSRYLEEFEILSFSFLDLNTTAKTVIKFN